MSLPDLVNPVLDFVVLAAEEEHRLDEEGIEHITKNFALAFAALFPVVSPVGAVPLFLSVTRGMPEKERRSNALKSVVAASIVLVLFLVVGKVLLNFFGIGLSALQLAGGAVVASIGWQMTTGPSFDPDAEPPTGGNVWFTPMTMPWLAGPGAMGIVLGFGSRTDSWQDYIGFVLGILAVQIVAFVLLVYAKKVDRVMGPTGMDAMNRILGMLILAIAAEMLFHGITEHTD